MEAGAGLGGSERSPGPTAGWATRTSGILLRSVRGVSPG